MEKEPPPFPFGLALSLLCNLVKSQNLGAGKFRTSLLGGVPRPPCFVLGWNGQVGGGRLVRGVEGDCDPCPSDDP